MDIQVSWHMPWIPVLGSLREEILCKFEAHLANLDSREKGNTANNLNYGENLL